MNGLITFLEQMAGVLVVINFLVSLVIYYPFFKVFEKEQIASELAEG